MCLHVAPHSLPPPDQEASVTGPARCGTGTFVPSTIDGPRAWAEEEHVTGTV